MAKKEPTVAWQVLLDDAQWEQDAVAPVGETADNSSHQLGGRQWLSRRWLIPAVLVLVTVGVAGGWLLWQRAQTGLAAIAAEIEQAALAESAAQEKRNGFLAQALLDPAAPAEWREGIVLALMEDESAPPVPVVEDVELLDGVRLVHLTISDPDLPLLSRTVRFYREHPSGWLRTAPVPSAWGEGDLWEGDQFVFRFWARDRDAVLAAAPQIEAAYVQMRQNLGLPTLPSRQTIVVLPDDSEITFDFASKELRLPSPQLQNLPIGLDNETALFRAATFYLINDLVQESFDRYSRDHIWIWSNLTESGLRNWLQLTSGAVGIDQGFLLPWLFDDEAQRQGPLPDRVAEACQAVDALGVRVALLACTPDISARSSTSTPALRLSRLTTTYDFDFAEDANLNVTPSGPMWHTETRQEIFATTTVFLYAVDVYGLERFPDLLQALGDYRGWAEAIPAAYGVSAVEFEAGWLAWLATEFDIGR